MLFRSVSQSRYRAQKYHKVYSSETLSSLWPHGISELGSVTFESAGYVARYAVKKLVHGLDGAHDFDPIHKRSSRHAIGKRFLEKFWRDIYSRGECVVYNSAGVAHTVPIPRYYDRWLLQHNPSEYVRYVTEIKSPNSAHAAARAERQAAERRRLNAARALGRGCLVPEERVRAVLAKSRLKRLNGHLKGDI